MASVSFDAPQSLGDELLGADGLETEFITELAEDSGLAEVAGSVDLPDYSPDDVITLAEPVAVEVSGDPIQVVNEQLTQVAREISVDHYESERSEEADLLDQIWNAERDCRKAESRVELLKEELKEAKSQYEQSMLRLREIINENSGCFHNSGRPHVSVTFTTPATTEATQPATDEPQAAEPQAVEDQPATTWRAVPLSELLREPIKGLGTKKQEALIDLCPTLGDLEDLRARVGREAAQFHELLPKGIGLETASTIEDRLLTWIAKNPKACEGDAIPESTLQTRSEQLSDDLNGFIHRHPNGNGYWQSGFSSFHAGATLDECPWTAGVEQDDWLRGWLRAQADCAEAKYASCQDGEPSEEVMTMEDDEPAADPVQPTKSHGTLRQASSLDDL